MVTQQPPTVRRQGERERTALPPRPLAVPPAPSAPRGGGLRRLQKQKEAGRNQGRLFGRVLLGTFLLTLLGCFYISAYARWQGDTADISRLRGDLRAAQVETQRLEAEVSRFETPQYVRGRASELKLLPPNPDAVKMTPVPEGESVPGRAQRVLWQR